MFKLLTPECFSTEHMAVYLLVVVDVTSGDFTIVLDVWHLSAYLPHGTIVHYSLTIPSHESQHCFTGSTNSIYCCFHSDSVLGIISLLLISQF